MRQDKFSPSRIVLYVCGIVPVIWLGLLLAPAMRGGLRGFLEAGGSALSDPFHVEICEGSAKTVLVFLLCYGLGLTLYLSNETNYRRREEHGSAKWGRPSKINRKYQSSQPTENKIMTQNVRIGLDGRRHRRNLNTLVCGGSGAGKTRFFAKPNVMNANTSFVVLDPKGELLRDTGHLLEAKGYDIKVIDLINMEKSHCYNPFVYLHSDNDKTAEEMAQAYSFNTSQNLQLSELLAEENQSLWSSVLYGIGIGDDAIVQVALSQIGNVGGQPYWSWYGFGGRVEWCACFVSWCANECGYLDAGVIPKFSGCEGGSQWFKDRGLWQDRYYEPRPGDLIFFDWVDPETGVQDGSPDHVGIVERVEGSTVHTVEGNSGDACRENSYTLGYFEIFGYGTPAY